MNIEKTTLGPNLIEEKENIWSIDLSSMKIFHGFSILSKILSDKILEKVDSSLSDIFILHKISKKLNPELKDSNISHIQIYIKSDIITSISNKDYLQNALKIVLGTFQRPKQIEDFLENKKISKQKVLLFHLEFDQIKYYFILEKISLIKENGTYFLRLTIVKSNIKYLSLYENIKEVTQLQNRVFIDGSTKSSQLFTYNIQINIYKNKNYFHEENTNYNPIFQQILKTELGNIESINFYWDKSFSKLSTESIFTRVKILLLCIEDKSFCYKLKKRKTVKIKVLDENIFVYLTRLNRVLNFSFNVQNKIPKISDYIQKTPNLLSILNKENHKFDYKNTNIFLVHHITAEILSLINIFLNLDATRVNTSFVQYSGKVPMDYLDALLNYNPDRLFSSGLSRKVTEDNIDYYSLSTEYSDISHLSELQKVLENEKWNFYQAMHFLATHLFLRDCINCYINQEKIILIEDGGYVAPFLNKFCREKKTIIEVLDKYKISYNNVEDILFSEWIKNILLYSVEHTLNGHQKLEIENMEKKLTIPAYSIAKSNIKVKEESKEVANSIINAIESILYGQGFTLSDRKIAILGGEGNIGKFLCKYLKFGKLKNNDNLISIDIKKNDEKLFKFQSIFQIPKEILLSIDMFIGVIGESILDNSTLEYIILNSHYKDIFFSSGSTKTVEYSHLSEYIKILIKEKKISFFDCSIEFDDIIDPQSKIEKGSIIRMKIYKENEEIERNLYLLGNLTPINFAYYGVPSKAIDPIISLLSKVSLGVYNQHKNNIKLEDGLYTVDHNIDEWGDSI